MAARYDYVRERAALEVLVGCAPRRRARLLRRFERLAATPFLPPDITLRDLNGRELAVLDLADAVLTYRVDHAGCEVRIISLDLV